MSFFKKMTEKLEDVVGDKKKHEGGHEGAPAGYGHDQSSSYGHQHQSFGGPPPSHSGPPAGPPLPPGWIAQWDQNSQRNYYLEQATGRTQWEPPQASYGGPPPPMGGGYGTAPGYGAPGGSYSQQYQQYTDSHGNQHRELHEKKQKSGKGGMLAAGAGGLAVGAVGGAMVGHAMGDDSDEERKAYGTQQQPTYVQETNYYQDSGPPMAPPLDADHGSVSSSDKEELQEAREDYENASASDKESARDEYEEQYEETYDD
ncbi:MAG: hypothetical protein Q9164_006871 [Protoblastenia rupestris]